MASICTYNNCSILVLLFLLLRRRLRIKHRASADRCMIRRNSKVGVSPRLAWLAFPLSLEVPAPTQRNKIRWARVLYVIV